MTLKDALEMSYDDFRKIFNETKIPIDPTYKDTPKFPDKNFWEVLRQGSEESLKDKHFIKLMRRIIE